MAAEAAQAHLARGEYEQMYDTLYAMYPIDPIAQRAYEAHMTRHYGFPYTLRDSALRVFRHVPAPVGLMVAATTMRNHQRLVSDFVQRSIDAQFVPNWVMSRELGLKLYPLFEPR